MKILIEKILLDFVVSIYIFFNLSLDLLKFLLFWRVKIPRNIRKILIFRVGNIGDTICAVPSVVTIRENFPKAEIVLLSSPGKHSMHGAKELLGKAKFLNKLIVYHQEDINDVSGKLNLTKNLRKEKFDLFIELPQDLSKFRVIIRNMIFAKIIGTKYAFGFQISTIKLFKQIQSKYLKFDNEVKRLLKILKKERLKLNKVSFPLPISESDIEVVSEFLGRLNRKNFVALNPNAKRQTNLWPLNRFAEVGKELIKKFNIKILIIGGKNDKPKISKLKEMIGEEAINIAGKFSLLQTIELLKHCRLLISNDTGAIHMATAVGCPVIGIYSAWQLRGKWFPYGERNIILRKEPECHTCFKEYCRHLTCLKIIDIDTVKETIKRSTNL